MSCFLNVSLLITLTTIYLFFLEVDDVFIYLSGIVNTL